MSCALRPRSVISSWISSDLGVLSSNFLCHRAINVGIILLQPGTFFLLLRSVLYELNSPWVAFSTGMFLLAMQGPCITYNLNVDLSALLQSMLLKWLCELFSSYHYNLTYQTLPVHHSTGASFHRGLFKLSLHSVPYSFLLQTREACNALRITRRLQNCPTPPTGVSLTALHLAPSLGISSRSKTRNNNSDFASQISKYTYTQSIGIEASTLIDITPS
eukprot:Gb_05957 [translate_table: standard]